MKVLFGINNDNTVKDIVEFYQDRYKEKIEYKNVYYFKQFIQELSANKYDRAVMLEELEKFPTNNYAQIDDYLFKNIDSMTDVFDAKDIIYIASDRRKLGDEFLSKLFNLGIYTVLTDQNRTKGKVCEGIHAPYLKKDVKKYYDNVVGENVYKSGEVSEIEIQRIISYYKNQSGVADKYNEIFDRIATQYTNEQLKVIINFLPADVKQHLAFNNEKYKALMNTVNPTLQPTPGVNNVAQQTGNEKQSQPQPQQSQQVQKPQHIIDNNKDVSNRVEVKKEPQIVEKIVVQQVEKPASVVTQVVEKEVVRSVYEVPKDYKKVVCFVGAPKVGTTFCINAVATFLARNKVKTAIVDVTRKRDTYTIYTYDNEGKRNIAAQSMKYASSGMNEPLIYDKLSIYTGMPGEDRKTYNANVAIETIMANNNVILIDSDFTTPTDFFRLCQEIYLVQDMDILNINQVTMFLRELKSRGIPLSKLRVIINKHVKCALTSRDILDGIATYTSYDLKMYDELLNVNQIPYFILPFDVENYTKYVEMVYKYSNKFATFTDFFKENIFKVINSIYPVAGTMKGSSSSYSAPTQRKSRMSGIFKKTPRYSNTTTTSGFEKEVK